MNIAMMNFPTIWNKVLKSNMPVFKQSVIVIYLQLKNVYDHFDNSGNTINCIWLKKLNFTSEQWNLLKSK